MKDNNNHIEVLMYSKELTAQWSQSQIVKWFTTTIQPALDKQEAYAKKQFSGPSKISAPIYLS